jgi:ADP-ribosylglycohydrolase
MVAEQERIKGSLLGLAWGDVFGCPVELWSGEQIAAVYGSYTELPQEHPLDRIAPLGKKVLKYLRPLGLHSDDTQQCLALLQVCLSPGGWSSQVWGQLLVRGMKEQAWRGYGRNFRVAVDRLERGESPRRSGSPSPGIGSVMRIGPVGALYRDHPDRLAQVVFESSLSTHANIQAGAGAYAVAWAVAALVSGLDAAEVMARLPDEVAAEESNWLRGHADWTFDRSAGPLVSQCLRSLFAPPSCDPKQTQERISALARPHLPPEFRLAHPNQGHVLLGGLHALAVALTVDEPVRALTELVALGHDTDTVGAICGSLLGARFGLDWVPRQRLLDGAILQAYAEAMVTRTAAPEEIPAFLKREAMWTWREEDFQRAVLASYT